MVLFFKYFSFLPLIMLTLLQNTSQIDPSIYPYILLLNQCGYVTCYSCSGTFRDHYNRILKKNRTNRLCIPYLSFDESLTEAQREKIMKSCFDLGITFSFSKNEFCPNQLVLKFYNFERVFEPEVIGNNCNDEYHLEVDAELLKLWKRLIIKICDTSA